MDEKTFASIKILEIINGHIDLAEEKNIDFIYNAPVANHIIRALLYTFFRSEMLTEMNFFKVIDQSSINENDLNYNYFVFTINYHAYLIGKYNENNDKELHSKFYSDYLIDYSNIDLKRRLFGNVRELLVRLDNPRYNKTYKWDMRTIGGESKPYKEIMPFKMRGDGILHYMLMKLCRIPEANESLYDFLNNYDPNLDDIYTGCINAILEKKKKKGWFRF